MGQLEFHNDAPILAYVRWSYDGERYTSPPYLGSRELN